jgi:hypothetical protein
LDVDFAQARASHLAWRTRLRNYFMGERSGGLSEAQARSPHHCDLGRWLDSTGLSRYAQVPEMARLTHVHTRLHEVVGRAMDAKDAGNEDAAERALAHLESLSVEIMDLLAVVERHMA